MKKYILLYMTLDGQASNNESLYDAGSFGEICGRMFATKEDAIKRLNEIMMQDVDESREHYPEEDDYIVVIEPGKMEETELNVYYHEDVVYQTRYQISEVEDC